MGPINTPTSLDRTDHVRNGALPEVEVPEVGYSENDALLNVNGAPSAMKQSRSYGGRSASPIYGGITMDSPSPPRRPNRALRGQDSSGSLSQSHRSTGSFVLPNGLRASFRGGHPITETMIIADDELLPPETPLYGSSKFAANARVAEIRRIDSKVSFVRDQSISNISKLGDHCDDATITSVRTARTLKEIEEEYLEKAR